MTTTINDINQAGNHRLVALDELKPGVPYRVLHEGTGILLCLVEGTVHAVHDTCTHEDISLSLGVLCEHRLRCPLHGSQFDIRTGKVLDEPAEADLPVFDVSIVDGWVCI
ncbi:non-heme iron oxygenase ferredoxin subunit [Granulosicoccus antarcticus]|uniref:Toluene 1,2-dioxygenase system ferredoxin subunit n=1 Tax=Granulosicoccus antarcticus IMCC3135 TaxID=1192854 RepID=A0A2Z2NK15_9GAMM|nr:non-heme iron oxygenase ferredoxin subunit [Granulosicoccus antarcticus]ASJ71519.1 Toluene 1,2-dioxygenase system ferredoxin subunit [Granulosicoccus antarcticus IMCC3135]